VADSKKANEAEAAEAEETATKTSPESEANRTEAQDETPVEDVAEGTAAAEDSSEAAEEAPAEHEEPAVPADEPEPAAAAQADIPQPAPVDPVPAPAPEAPRRRGGFLGTVLGGVIAAAIGFGAAQYLGPDMWPFGGGAENGTAEALDAQTAQISDLSSRMTALDAAVTELNRRDPAAGLSDRISETEAAIASRLDGLRGDLGQVSGKLDAIETRLIEVEKRPIAEAGGDVSGAVEAYEKELQAMRNELAAQRAHNEDLAKQVAAAAETATSEIDAAAKHAKALETRAAMMRIMAVLETGGGFGPALQSIEGVEIPAALRSVANDGVPTLADLQAGFADPARDALAIALRETPDGDTADRLSAFLRTQLGARSLEPREGDDPDAVLSRAEAALGEGALDTALEEIAALPDGARAVMAGWVAQAELRRDALVAADALAQSLNVN